MKPHVRYFMWDWFFAVDFFFAIRISRPLTRESEQEQDNKQSSSAWIVESSSL